MRKISACVPSLSSGNLNLVGSAVRLTTYRWKADFVGRLMIGEDVSSRGRIALIGAIELGESWFYDDSATRY